MKAAATSELCNVCTNKSPKRETNREILKRLAREGNTTPRSIQKASEVIRKCIPEIQAAIMRPGSKFTINDCYAIRNLSSGIQELALAAVDGGHYRNLQSAVKAMNLPDLNHFDAMKESRSLRQVVRRLATIWPRDCRGGLAHLLRDLASEVEQ